MRFENFSDLANYIHESGYIIGNDFGIGHLASCLGMMPTLTIFARKKISLLWCSDWSNGEITYPPIQYSGYLAHPTWHYFILVRKVINALRMFVQECRCYKHINI